ncbi:Pol polyprotein [Plakobranchus ocellatus]|uniref:Pol polyprotein n=1 Tax=Plakobranchus ocellatus TaxID=259542 RepID=A0AAV4CD03_9GAST|nr:Pol polyprotein [Plakobranchus ocellatus]
MLPNLDDIAPNMAGLTIFSILHAAPGFSQIPTQDESKLRTMFIAPFGRSCYAHVPVGICLGPEYFQTKMTECLKGREGCEAVMITQSSTKRH